ncbi:hypothetical protein LM801050_210390 [Listeria monocytogenes]|nr:hypothetical protein LM4423_60778 [Listeria monocytogenes 4423]CUK91655.1 hypothetical protein LM701014_220562 [Listeria monocytogenes]CUL15681.1 hypothetical protein LM701398_190391 [Listeria monocytogenes]CUL28325.1 hypothetical protein LM73068_190490 [Listeria monocytogenes]CUL63569.1 hypothetical protein LM801050_210390 [Listeria monocytogenes]
MSFYLSESRYQRLLLLDIHIYPLIVYHATTPYPGYHIGYFKAFINIIIPQNKNTLKKKK